MQIDKKIKVSPRYICGIVSLPFHAYIQAKVEGNIKSYLMLDLKYPLVYYKSTLSDKTKVLVHKI